MKIDKCQAGNQRERGCPEQMLALRLLMDYAKCKKKKLFICFIDFSKAYDRVSRPILFRVLYEAGCGRAMLKAIMAMYRTTKNILKTAIVNSKRGVKQGGSTSGLFFIQYMNPLAVLLKNACPDDDYLADLHSLMLMDDTAIVATSRERLLQRFDALVEFCEKYEMIINEDKTQFMVIDGEEEDRISFHKGGVTVTHTEQYIYLGNPFLESGDMPASLKSHADLKTKHLNKFKLFCVKNQNMPFPYKKKVFDAVMTTKILYGCESWLTDSLKSVESLYMGALKSLLGVRIQTTNNIVLIEAGAAPLKDRVWKQQKNFLKKKLQDVDEPLTKVYRLCERGNTKGYKYLQRVMNFEYKSLDNIRATVTANTTSTRLNTYKTLNPELAFNKVYQEEVQYIPDYVRVEYTRFRTGSHKLNVETGRWSRVPADERYCTCDNQSIQNELHVMYDCPFTETLRQKFQINQETPIEDMFGTKNVFFIYEVMKIFK